MNSVFPMVALGDLLVPISRPEAVVFEKRYSILGAHWYAKGLYIKDVKLGTEIQADKVYRVEEGDFVYNRLFAWKGSFAIVSKEDHGCYVSNEFPCFKVKQDRIDGQYLWKYFSKSSAWDEALGLSSGGTPTSRNRLKEEKLLEMKIPLPSLEEQRRVVARIEELAVKIEEARGLRREAVGNMEKFLRSLKESKLRCEGNTLIRDFATIQSGYAFKSDYFENSGIRLVRNTNISHGYIDWQQVAFISEADFKSFSRFNLSEGDILISLDRPIISTGIKVARVTERDLPCLLVQRVGRVLLKNNAVLTDYFFEWLNSPYFENAINPGRSNGIPHISPKDIELIPFAAPSLSEQQNIVAYLHELQSKVYSLKQLQDETSAELDALLPSILDKAFKGELS